MKFEDLKLPDLSGPSLVVAIHTARAVYDQMREHYEGQKQPAPEWRLPDPPPGQQWHRDDWTQDMLVDAEGRQYRPLLLGEKPGAGDEVLFDEWTVQSKSQRRHPVRSGECHQRTRRPLPAPVEYVPLGPEDVPPGSAVRYFGKQEWQAVLEVDSHLVWTRDQGFSWRYLADQYEILRPGSTTWEPCKKPKA